MARFHLAADLYDVYYDMRLTFGERKFAIVVRDVQKYVNATPRQVADFIDGGADGWDCGDDEQGEWLNSETAMGISSWVVAGLR